MNSSKNTIQIFSLIIASFGIIAVIIGIIREHYFFF